LSQRLRGRLCLPALLLLAAALVAVPASAAAPGADAKQKAADRVAYNQIKDRTFTGVRGDGAEVVWTFCADGRFEANTDGGISKGNSWKVSGAVVKQGGKSIKAFVEGSGGFEVALLKQGPQWKVGVASLGRVLYPGKATRTSAAATCAAL
jgi:hypothetical protein